MRRSRSLNILDHLNFPSLLVTLGFIHSATVPLSLLQRHPIIQMFGSGQRQSPPPIRSAYLCRPASRGTASSSHDTSSSSLTMTAVLATSTSHHRLRRCRAGGTLVCGNARGACGWRKLPTGRCMSLGGSAPTIRRNKRHAYNVMSMCLHGASVSLNFSNV